MEHINEKLNKICDLPRPKRSEVRKILEGIYKEGKNYTRKYEKMCNIRRIHDFPDYPCKICNPRGIYD